MKNKSNTNFIIDAIMFLAMMALVGTGYVRKYVLLSGSASKATYGYKVNMTLLGWNRDDWSIIHLYVGYFILALLVLHIVLHWKQIKIMYQNLVNSDSLRLFVTIIFVLFGIFLALFPFIIAPISL